MSIDTKRQESLDVPENVRLWAIDESGQLIHLVCDTSGQLKVDVELGDELAILSGEVHVLSGDVVVESGQIEVVGQDQSGAVRVPMIQSGTRKLAITASGSEIGVASGEVHVMSGELIAKVSGETVSVASGAEIIWRGVQVSGAVIVSGDVKISGETVTVASGAEIIWRGVQVSGTVGVSGEVTSKISGEAILAARNLPTPGLSGAPTIASGDVGWLLTDADGRAIVGVESGEIHILSGEVVAKVSGETVSVASGVEIIWRGVQVSGTVEVSGGVVVSGTVRAEVSGDIVKISGETVSLQSGTTVLLESGTKVKVSGEVLKVIAPSALLADYVQITDQSGGTELASGAIVHVTVTNINESGHVWVGPAGILSGDGYLLEAMGHRPALASIGMDVDNLNKVYVFAEMSGDYVSYLAEVE